MTTDLLTTRGKTHGPFLDTSRIAQDIKTVFRSAPGWSALAPFRREALEAIATKLARLLCGDPNHPDHARDIAGYALLLDGQDRPIGDGQEAATAARDVPTGERWIFPEHRTQAEVLAEEATPQAPAPRHTRRTAKSNDVAIRPRRGI